MISPQIFKKNFLVINEIIQETATMSTNEFDARDQEDTENNLGVDHSYQHNN